ncbi:hypothetical protein Tco_0724998 [Tanacetum coccineum]|uniref:Uncharacterized protein n=1 Tax=Tanacetum coccineum TaxID=301880 RepID=A0ABQ4YE09_9ASTR
MINISLSDDSHSIYRTGCLGCHSQILSCQALGLITREFRIALQWFEPHNFTRILETNFYRFRIPRCSITKSITVLPDEIAGTLAEAVNAWKKLVLLRMSTDI